MATLLKILLGAFFIFSALSKFVGIDLLNIYIFSFDILSWDLSVIAGWMLISIEVILGVALLSNRHHRWVCLMNMLLLLAFTLFLGYAQLSGRTDSCHCMGELLPFSPVQSMLKNALLITAFIFVWKYADETYQPKWWVPSLTIVLLVGLLFLCGRMGWVQMTFIDFQYASTLAFCLLVVGIVWSSRLGEKIWCIVLGCLTPLTAIFILSVAANWIHSDKDVMVDEDRFSSVIATDGELSDAHLDDGKKVVCFFSRTCSYCRIASQKISLIQQRNDLPKDAFVNVFPGTDTIGIGAFYSENSVRYQHYLLDPTSSVMITYGQFPLVLLVDQGRVVSTFGHGDISESQITQFLQ